MKYRLFLLSILLVVTASLASCDLLSSRPKREGRGYQNFGLELWVSQERTGVGEPIDLVFTVKNDGDETEIIETDEDPVMDILVGQGDHYEREVWWSDGREITPEMRKLELAPGESKTIEMTWVAIGRTDGADASDARAAGILRYESARGEQKKAQVRIVICVENCEYLL